MRPAALLLLALLLPAATGAQQPQPAIPQGATTTTRHANGRIHEHGPVDDQGRRTGDWIERHANGRIAAFGSYQEGRRHGQWTFCDQWGRTECRVWYHGDGTGGQEQRADTTERPPLTLDDLRLTLVGERTLDDVLAACRPAPDAATRQRLAPELAALGPIAAAVVCDEATRADGAARRDWLRLMAELPVTAELPSQDLIRWLWQDELAEAAAAVLTRWSEQFRVQWQPLVEDRERTDRAMGLRNLGVRAFAALAALRAELVEVADDSPDHVALWPIAWALPEVVGRTRHSGPALLRDATGDDRAFRLQALAVISHSQPAVPIPAATLLTLLRHADPATVHLAGRLAQQIGTDRPAAWDDHLPELLAHPLPNVRATAVWRLCRTGRGTEVLPQLRELTHEPGGSLWPLDAPAELARWSDDRAADRSLLLELAPAGRIDAAVPLARLADDDVRAVDLLVDHALRAARPHEARRALAMLTGPMRTRALQALHSVLAGEGPTEERHQALAMLLELEPDLAKVQKLVVTALGDPAGPRGLALHRLGQGDLGNLEHAAPRWWEAVLRDEATREAAWQTLERLPLPADLDPTAFPGAPITVLATWADGDPDRTARLVDRAIARHEASAQALAMLARDLAPFAKRLLAAALDPATPGQLGAQLASLLPPEAHREYRVSLAMRWVDFGPTRFPHGRTLQGGICEPADIPVLCRHLAGSDTDRQQAALILLGRMGPDGAAAAPLVEAAVAQMSTEALVLVPAVVLAIAPAKATAVCGLLLDHGDPTVRLAALDPGRSHRFAEPEPIVPADPQFCRDLVDAIAALPADEVHGSGWLQRMGDGAVAALPHLVAALGRQPGHRGLATALGVLGPLATSAGAELRGALAAGNTAAAVALARVFPDAAWVRDLLLAELAEPDPQMLLAALEALCAMNLRDATTLRALHQLATGDHAFRRLQGASALAWLQADDADTVAALAVFLQRHFQQEAFAVRAALGDAAFLKLLRTRPDAEQEVWLIQRLQARHQTPPHPDVVAALADRIDSGRDRTGMLQALAMAAPDHPLVAGLSLAAFQPWNEARRGWFAAVGQSKELVALRLLTTLTHGEARDQGIEQLRPLGRAAVDLVLPHLDDLDTTRRILALSVLAGLGPVAAAALPDCAALLRDPFHGVQASAARAVVALTPDAATAAAVIRDALGGSRSLLPVLQAVPAEVGRLVLPAAPIDLDQEPWHLPLVLRIRGADADLIARLGRALAAMPRAELEALLGATHRLGPAAAPLVPQLRTLLRLSEPRFRQLVVIILGALGPAAAAAVSDLEALLPVPSVRFGVLDTLARVRGR